MHEAHSSMCHNRRGHLFQKDIEVWLFGLFTNTVPATITVLMARTVLATVPTGTSG